ncbi:MAG TPA: glycerophosphodiester phosphodiesterase [Verrucomicrobiae bacterium]
MAAEVRLEIIAHRGASQDAPENTRASVNLAWEQGADAVEVDVQLSKDGRLVVIHDTDTGRTAGRRKRVGQQTLAELRALDAGGWKGAQWTGERIPTLAEVLDLIPDGKRLLVEIKCGPECLAEFARVLRASGKRATQIVPIGFSLETMRLFKQRLPGTSVLWVAKFSRSWKTGRWIPKPDDLIRRATTAGVDGLDVSARGPITAATVARVHAAGLGLYVWTVDSAAKARQLAAAGVDGIATNRPQWLREQLRD